MRTTMVKMTIVTIVRTMTVATTLIIMTSMAAQRLPAASQSDPPSAITPRTRLTNMLPLCRPYPLSNTEAGQATKTTLRRGRLPVRLATVPCLAGRHRGQAAPTETGLAIRTCRLLVWPAPQDPRSTRRRLHLRRQAMTIASKMTMVMRMSPPRLSRPRPRPRGSAALASLPGGKSSRCVRRKRPEYASAASAARHRPWNLAVQVRWCPADSARRQWIVRPGVSWHQGLLRAPWVAADQSSTPEQRMECASRPEWRTGWSLGLEVGRLRRPPTVVNTCLLHGAATPRARHDRSLRRRYDRLGIRKGCSGRFAFSYCVQRLYPAKGGHW